LWCVEEGVLEVVFFEFGQRCKGGTTWGLDKWCLGLVFRKMKVLLQMGEAFGASSSSGVAMGGVGFRRGG